MAETIAVAILAETATAAEIAAMAATIETGMTVASMAATGFSMASSIAQGNNMAAITKSNAAFQQAQIDSERDALQTEASLKALDNVKALRQTIAQNEAYYAATGADLSSGTPVSGQEKNMEEANRQMSIDRVNTMMKNAKLTTESQGLSSSASAMSKQYRTQGFASATGSLISAANRFTSRGSVPRSAPSIESDGGWRSGPGQHSRG